MSTWTYEMKKMFILHKGLLFIGLFFILSFGSLLFLDKPVNPEVELNASAYSFYLQQVQGLYTEETEHFFKNEARNLSNANVSLQKASDDYYDGNTGEKEFLSIAGPLEQILQHEKGFKLIYDQYTYVRENPANRYFLYANGWDGLLSNDRLDFLFMLLLLLLLAPGFCFEYESRMDELLLTVKKGTRIHAVSKIGLAFATVALLCLLNAALQYGFYEYKYGLDNGSYPLQSLSYFGTSTKESTLLETFLWVTAGKLFGSLCFAMLIMFVSVYVKRYALTLFLCTAMLLLPYYGFSLESSKYFLPGPLAFMVSTGFFRGNEVKQSLFKEQADVVFREVSPLVWSIVFIATICLMIGMFAGILIRRTNSWNTRIQKNRMRQSSPLLLSMIMISLLSGCISSSSLEDRSIYNYSARQFFENECYRFYVDDTDIQRIRLVFEDKNNGVTRDFVRNPLSALTRVENVIYGNKSHVYYMKYDFDKSGFMEAVRRFSIIEVDTATFREKIIFEKNLSTDKRAALGLAKANNYDVKFWLSTSSFFLDQHSLYFIGEDEIRRVSRLTGDMRVIIRFPVLRSVAFDGRTIYYINEKSQVIRYDTATDSETVVPDLVTRYFVLTDGELLFLNRKDQQKIYGLNLHDFSVRKITERPVLDFTCDEQTIFYVDKSGTKKYRIDRDGRNDRLIQD